MANNNYETITSVLDKYDMQAQVIRGTNPKQATQIIVKGCSFSVSSWTSEDITDFCEWAKYCGQRELQKHAEYMSNSGSYDKQVWEYIPVKHMSMFESVDYLLEMNRENRYYNYKNYVKSMIAMHGSKYGQKIADSFNRKELFVIDDTIVSRHSLEGLVKAWCKAHNHTDKLENLDEKIDFLVKKMQEIYRG